MQPIFARGNSRTPNRLVRLRQEAQTDKQPRVILRIQAILDSLDHQTPPQIASRLRVHRTRVHDWIRRWNDQGEAALLEGHRSWPTCRAQRGATTTLGRYHRQRSGGLRPPNRRLDFGAYP